MKWGVRMEDGTVYGGLSRGDAENLEVITDGRLVRWIDGGWKEVD